MKIHWLSIALLSASLLSKPALCDEPEVPEINIRHISTMFANMGMCSARFGIEGLYDVELELSLSFLGPSGEALTQGTISTRLEASSAGKYVEEFVESEAVCELPDNTKVVITKAIAKTSENTFDLIKLGKLNVEYFQPYRIEIGQPSAELQKDH
jgi:hypothetical protein